VTSPIERVLAVADARADPVAPREAGAACRNCGAEAPGRYCPNCGQETTLELPSASLFLREAAGRYIALDSRLWRSLGALLFRPGFLTREYLAGRRRRYVRPARLFVALSIALFAILRFTGGAVDVVDTGSEPAAAALVREANPEAATFGVEIDRNLRIDLRAWPQLAPLRSRIDAFNRLPKQEKLDRLQAGVLRYAPYAAIGLLPVFALLVKIAYAGRQRRHPPRPRQYAAHLVFGAHNHAFVFLAASLMALVGVGLVRVVLAAWSVVYLLLAMKAVYGGGWLGVVLRAFFIAAFYWVFFALAVVALLVAAVTLR
jgi:uncharacterized protein DUF3667